MSDLLNLPRHLLESVYDLLHVKDRFRLNMALPHAHTITDTLATCPENDKKLAIMQTYFKRIGHELTYNTLTCQMVELIEENLEDPTVREVLQHNPAFLLGFENRFKINEMVKLIRSPNDLAIDEESFSMKCDNLSGCEEVMGYFERYGRPATFDIIMRGTSALQQSFLENWSCFVFGIICKGNEHGLLKHIMEQSNNTNKYAEKTRAYLANENILLWFINNPKQLREIVDNVGVTKEILMTLLNAASSQLYIDSVIYLKQAMIHQENQ